MDDRCDATFQMKTRGLTSAFHRRSDAPDLIAMIGSMDASSRPSIVRRLFIGRSRPKINSINTVLRDRKKCP